MWLLTTDGMFCVTLAGSDKDDQWANAELSKVTVRAYRRGHLKRLRKRYDIHQEISKKSGASCPYRITMLRHEFAHVASQLATDIDYDAFDEAARKPRSKHGRKSGFLSLLGEISEFAATRLRKSSS